jgi:hypothetical protein
MIAFGAVTILFASISVVSALVLAVLVYQQSTPQAKTTGMDAFHRHLDALSDDSRAHLRAQLRDSRNRQGHN